MNNKFSHLVKSNKFLIFLIILVLAGVYFKSLSHNLIFLDDDALIYNKFNGMSLSQEISTAFTTNYLEIHYYRPVTLLSLITDSLIGGQSPFIYHLTNLLIHLFVSLLIFEILKELGFSLLTAFLTTLFFALSTIQINAVGWIAGRGDLLAAFFSVAALLIFIKFLKHNKTYLLIFVTALLFIAILAKEVSLPIPFLFLAFYFIEKKNYTLNKNIVGVMVMLLAVLGSYYLLRGLFLSGVYIDKFSFTTYYKNILVLPETISKFFIPIGIKALPGIETFTSISGIILICLLLFLPLKLKSINKPRYYFGFLWFVILLLPGMVFRTMGQDGFYYWDCRSYLPLVGVLFMIGEILQSVYLEKYKYHLYLLAAAYLMALSTMTFIKINLYENPLTYWNSVRTDYPTSFLPYVGLFNYYNHQEDIKNAEDQLLQAITIRPEELSIRNSLINFYLKQKSFDKAMMLLKKTLVDKKIHSDYLLRKYISLLVEQKRYKELDDLSNAYQDDKNVLKIINEIKSGLIKQSKNPDNTKL